MKFFLVFSAVLWVGVSAQAHEPPLPGKETTANAVSEKVSEKAVVGGGSTGGEVSQGAHVQAAESAQHESSSAIVIRGDVAPLERGIWVNMAPLFLPVPIFTSSPGLVDPIGSNPAVLQLASLLEREADKEPIDSQCGPNSPTADPWGSLLCLIKELFKESDITFWRRPSLQTHIDEQFCVYEIDLPSVPDTASVVVGVDGSTLSVDVSDASTVVKQVEVPEAKQQDSAAEGSVTASPETDKSAAEGSVTASPETDKSGKEANEPKSDEIEMYNKKGSLRGAGVHVARSHSHSTMHFAVNPVCDQHSLETVAARDKGKLLIRMPVKPKKPEDGKLEEEDTKGKDDSTTAKIDTADEKAAEKEEGKCQPEKRVIPLVSIEMF